MITLFLFETEHLLSKTTSNGLTFLWVKIALRYRELSADLNNLNLYFTKPVVTFSSSFARNQLQ